VFCDLPTIPDGPVGKFMVNQMSNVAELEAGLISQRTKAGPQAAKARGQVLGCKNDKIRVYVAQGAQASAAKRSTKAAKWAGDIRETIEEIRAEDATSLREVAAKLNENKVPTSRGGQWSAVQVMRVMSTTKA
jgi:DNA invertase Pin-like site-specific DNA recombinase